MAVTSLPFYCRWAWGHLAPGIKSGVMVKPLLLRSFRRSVCPYTHASLESSTVDNVKVETLLSRYCNRALAASLNSTTSKWLSTILAVIYCSCVLSTIPLRHFILVFTHDPAGQ